MKNKPTLKGRLITSLILLLFVLLLTSCTRAPTSSEETLSIGETLYRLLVGGPRISEVTLIRFYAWHVIALPGLMLLLIGWHGFRVRRDGGVSAPERQPEEKKIERVERSFIVRGETLTFFITLAVLIVLSVFIDPPIGPAAQLGSLTEHSQAPWIFLWVQELLRIWPPAIAGVLIPLAVLLLLTALPYVDLSNEGIAVWFNKQGRIAQIVMGIIFLIVLGLTIRAAVR